VPGKELPGNRSNGAGLKASTTMKRTIASNNRAGQREDPVADREVTWSWRCRTPNERTTCLVCDEPLRPHAFRYCSVEHARQAHGRAERLFGETYRNPGGEGAALRRRRKRRKARRASR
jgi:hypothetical protein